MMKLTNLKTGSRLTLGFGIVTAFVIAVTCLGWEAMRSLDAALDSSMDQAKRTALAEGLSGDINNISLDIWKFIGAESDGTRQAVKEKLLKSREDYGKKMEELKAGARTEEGKRLLGAIEEAISAARDTNNKTLELAQADKKPEALALFGKEGQEYKDKVDAMVRQYVDWRDKQMQEVNASGERLYARMQWLLGLTALAAFIISALLSWVITRSVVLPLQSGVNALERISAGDVTQNLSAELVGRKDEMGALSRAMQTMTENLRGLLSELSGGINTLSSSAAELSAISTQTSEGGGVDLGQGPHGGGGGRTGECKHPDGGGQHGTVHRESDVRGQRHGANERHGG